jgi:D-alanyl-lipoteichoic acid acyltransferase DltB (MBOAT superfamily)
MLFTTFDFLLFIIPVLLGFWALSHRPAARVLFLIGASYFFYMAGPKVDPPQPPWYFAGLVLFSTVLNYLCGAAIHRRVPLLEHDDPVVVARARRARNAYLALAVIGNLGLLGYFKYTNFFIQAFSDVARSLGLEVMVPHISLVFPIGISFFTFQSLSYTIDVWRQRLTPEPSFRKFALFVVFFPQLVAGPILRASQFLPQLHRRPQFTAKGMEEGLFRILQGVVKVIVLGNWIAGGFHDAVFSSPSSYTSLENLLALYAFTLQIYVDFSGYSDIAIGVGRLLGFHIPENFDRPYQATNIGEFWRRWHMTLSTWLRDYLFFPLGGSRGSPQRTYMNLWITMFLVGMWHGASWNFVIYSNLHAFAMVFNRWNRLRKRASLTLGRIAAWVLGLAALGSLSAWLSHAVLLLPEHEATGVGVFAVVVFLVVAWLPVTGTPLNTTLHVLITFHFTVLSRIFFRADTLGAARDMIARLVALDGLGVRPGLMGEWMWAALIFGTAYHFTPKRWVDEHLKGAFCRAPGMVLAILYAAIGVGLMHLMSTGPRAFIYFQF